MQHAPARVAKLAVNVMLWRDTIESGIPLDGRDRVAAPEHVQVRLSVVRTGTATVRTGMLGRYLATSRAVEPPRVRTTISAACTWRVPGQEVTVQVAEAGVSFESLAMADTGSQGHGKAQHRVQQGRAASVGELGRLWAWEAATFAVHCAQSSMDHTSGVLSHLVCCPDC